jgi:hypothetical protein
MARRSGSLCGTAVWRTLAHQLITAPLDDFVFGFRRYLLRVMGTRTWLAVALPVSFR